MATRTKSKPKRVRPGVRTRNKRAKKVLGEASGNGRASKAKSEWESLMEEMDELVFRGQLSPSQAVMAGLDSSEVMEQVLERHGQEQVWTWTVSGLEWRRRRGVARVQSGLRVAGSRRWSEGVHGLTVS
jgi:phosphoribosyl-ATP pyrophosphohydrolase